MAFEFTSIGSSVRTGKDRHKTILHSVSAHAYPGQMMAILGPSGCGKSTLLDILAGNTALSTSTAPSAPATDSATGQVRFRDEPIGAIPNYRKRVAYVTQDDVFIPVLTVRETLRFYAMLRLGDTDRVDRRVDELLEDVRLTHVADCMVGGLLPGGFSIRGISGGERRRLTIVCGMIADPEVILLDEPTSGLDAENALSIVELLHSFTQNRESPRIVICAIHQPRSSVFHLFSSVLVLSRGHQLYFGPPANLVRHFQALSGLPVSDFTSPADYALDAVALLQAKDSGKLANIVVVTDLGVSEPSRTDDSPPASVHHGPAAALQPAADAVALAALSTPSQPVQLDVIPFQRRFTVLLGRCWKYFIRNPGNVVARMFVCLFLGILVGLIYQNTPNDETGVDGRIRVLFFMCTLIILLPFQTITLFQDMRQYFVRERSSHLYNSVEYYLANMLIEFGLLTFCTFLFVTPAYFLVGLKLEAWAYFFALFQFIAMYLCSSTFMTLLSNVTPNTDMAFAFGAFFMCIFLLFSGFFVMLSNLPGWMRWIPYLTYVKYAFQGVVLNEFSGRSYGGAVLSMMEFDKEPAVMGGTFGITIIWLISFAFEALLALHYFPRIRQSKLFKTFLAFEG